MLEWASLMFVMGRGSLYPIEIRKGRPRETVGGCWRLVSGSLNSEALGEAARGRRQGKSLASGKTLSRRWRGAHECAKRPRKDSKGRSELAMVHMRMWSWKGLDAGFGGTGWIEAGN